MDKPAADRSARNGRGALAWTVFLVMAVVVVAALFAGTIRARLSSTGSAGSRPGPSGAPSPSPTPLPHPGPAPPRTLLAAL